MTKIRKTTKNIKETEPIIGQLYPVLIDSETGELLDGRERLSINPNWKRDKYAVPGETKEEKELNRLRIKHIANWARKDVNKTVDLTEIADRTGWRGLKPFSDFLGVSEDTISTYLPQKYKNELKSQQAQASRSAKSNLAKKTQKATKLLEEIGKEAEIAPVAESIRQEIASSIETTQKTLSDLAAAYPTEMTKNPFDQWLEKTEKELSLWECLNERPEGYGDKSFHGNCCPSIIYALLTRYSSLEDEKIMDPMVGSGTFIDVAKKMGYKDNQIIARDINPLREDIQYGDAKTTGLPDESLDFIFAHFPYWKLIEYTVDNPNDASKLKLDEFLKWSENVINESYRVLRKGKFLAIMIGNLRENGVIDLESKISEIGSKKFVLWDKIIKKIRTWDPETRGQRMGLAIARSRQHNYSVVNHDTILVFRKG